MLRPVKRVWKELGWGARLALVVVPAALVALMAWFEWQPARPEYGDYDPDVRHARWEKAATASVRGHITTETGEPVAGVRVYLAPAIWPPDPNAPHGKPTGTLTTGASGAFGPARCVPGRYWAHVIRDDSGRRWQQVAAPGLIEVTAGPRHNTLELTVALGKDYAVAGTVTDDTGAPLPGVYMAVHAHEPPPGNYRLASVPGESWWVRTDNAGQFELYGLRCFDRRPVDLYMRYEHAVSGRVFTYVQRGVPLGSQNVHVVAPAPGTITGQVYAADGTTPATADSVTVRYVELPGTDAIAPQPEVAASLQDGAFTLAGVPAGTAHVVANNAQGGVIQAVDVRPGQTTEDVRLDIEPHAVIAGTAQEQRRYGGRAFQIDLLHLPSHTTSGRVEAGPSGRFRMGRLLGGTYLARAAAYGSAYIQQTVLLEADATVQCDLSHTAESEVHGTVTYPEGEFDHVRVILSPSFAQYVPRFNHGDWQTLADGLYLLDRVIGSGRTYRLQGVPAGTWAIAFIAHASVDIVPIEWRPHQIHTVNLEAADSVQLDVDLTRAPGAARGTR
ncbi:MAG: hypothetical protein ACLFTT_02320 [Candidatus Hydrogenedentota bacterium]